MASDAARVVLGADGCRGGGWVVAVVVDGDLSWDWAADSWALLDLADHLGAAAVAADVPIGLPRVGDRRPCDRLAAALLGARRSSVFPAPPREVLGCRDYTAARAVAPSLSAQAFGLVPRIREVDEALRARGPRVHETVVEAHPETAFAALAAGRFALATKRSATGALQRLGLLTEALGDLPVAVPAGATLDDALDAAACAWVARRWAVGAAEVLGGEPDRLGLPMRIVV